MYQTLLQTVHDVLKIIILIPGYCLHFFIECNRDKLANGNSKEKWHFVYKLAKLLNQFHGKDHFFLFLL